jgi:hypothetical protein
MNNHDAKIGQLLKSIVRDAKTSALIYTVNQSVSVPC